MQFGLAKLQAFLRKNQDKIILIGDKHTLADCYPLLDCELPTIKVPYGEGYKNLQSCEYIWKKLTDLDATRNSMVFCLGGGVLCDMTAFAASCYLRGIPFVLCPTSLLAMVDASIGGKNGVNFLGYKNFIGSFKKAEEVFICYDFLSTLPHHEMQQGYVEMLKHGLIANKNHYDQVKLLFLTNEKLNYELIKDSIDIKLHHVNEDFYDIGIRKRLNFGHTIGHAIEAFSIAHSEENEEWSHGTCVALGILAESFISHKMTGLNDDELNEIVIVIQGMIKSLEKDIPDFDQILPFLLKDKKNDAVGINFSLLKSIGAAVENQIVDEAVIEESMVYLKSIR